MTTFTLPTEPVGPVWLLDHPEHGGPLRFDQAAKHETRSMVWRNIEHDIELPWVELLALGDVDDEYPGEPNLHGTCTPWHLDEITVYDAAGDEVFYLQAAHTTREEDRALAALVVELVNAHAAGDKDKDQSLEAAARATADRLALAVNELVLHWQTGVYVSSRTELVRLFPGLAGRLAAVVDAHAAVNR